MRDGGRKERGRERQTREATFCFSSHKALLAFLGLRRQPEALHSPRATQPAPGTHRGKPVVPNTGARAAHVQPTPSADRIDTSHTPMAICQKRKAAVVTKKVKTH